MTRHPVSESNVSSAGASGTKAQLENINIELEDVHLWKIFSCGLLNEMIITKSGRKLFPVVKLRLTGLEPHRMYAVRMDFIQKENCRWKYCDGSWSKAGKAEPCPVQTSYLHCRSPNYGSVWMDNAIQFDKLKVSNKEGKEMVRLNSLHYYEPVIRVYKAHTEGIQGTDVLVAEKRLPECSFMAVTSYQNQTITNLKKENNPFAKGFNRTPNDKDNNTKFEINPDNHCFTTIQRAEGKDIQGLASDVVGNVDATGKPIRSSHSYRSSRTHPYANVRKYLSENGYSGSYSHGRNYPTTQQPATSSLSGIYSTAAGQTNGNYMPGYMNGYTYCPDAAQSMWTTADHMSNVSGNNVAWYNPYGALGRGADASYYGHDTAYTTGGFGPYNAVPYTTNYPTYSALDYTANCTATNVVSTTTGSVDDSPLSSASSTEATPGIKSSPPPIGQQYTNVFF
ncbi:T-box transcription factor T-A-like [Paramacrobiotus metropolitanus]|uniref:T-box transcription factor T-A-like n=1 Tax=Paramacrobiotus metropolitanus TaxID=2943436 RepID=UPI0024457290|nr:T-box transcription factor T-A-like [Paramacrobiotus metropolitanus]